MAGDSDGLSGSVMLALCDDADSIPLVRECRELEERFGTHFTNVILNKSACSFKEMKKAVMDADKKTRRERCKEKAPMIAELAESPSWCKLWDHALDLGWKTVLGLKMLLLLLLLLLILLYSTQGNK